MLPPRDAMRSGHLLLNLVEKVFSFRWPERDIETFDRGTCQAVRDLLPVQTHADGTGAREYSRAATWTPAPGLTGGLGPILQVPAVARGIRLLGLRVFV